MYAEKVSAGAGGVRRPSGGKKASVLLKMVEIQPKIFSGLSRKRRDTINKELLNQLAPPVNHADEATPSLSNDLSLAISAVARPGGNAEDTPNTAPVVGFSKYTKFTPRNKA